ncbi:GTP 3',8-cyclase MoaA [Clostridium sp. LY3-2]|uniref:GTP 3',8-cyclase MoaA n=1 Tax=Clostridium sp. LY3-2 TaxID=2942482 RepID=UPI0021523AF7|nr:GTP 3',8-cyclase MoaA [Clostridium sp. LY3-2]MCR6515916.1 GTP 3',8-cyclase MoaA [Clostridium sp. LY3-2]
MKDIYGREIDYLRISLTDNCNLRCIYCMPSSNIEFSKEKLTEEEIIKIIKASEKIGIKKIRFTGGEPLVRKDLVKIIKETNSLEGIEDICLTTNGILLLEKLEELKENGLTKVNISLDTLNPLKYKKITRGGDINLVLKAIDKCLNLGIKVKLNVVIIKGLNDDEIIDLINLTKEKDIDVRFIELMPIGEGNKFTGISNEEIKDLIKNYEYKSLKQDKKDGPANYIKLKGAKGKIGFISALSNCFCENCNRIRITSDGMLKGCLNWKGGVNLKREIEKGISEEKIKDIIKDSIYNKPEKYLFKKEDKNKEIRFMNQIGG